MTKTWTPDLLENGERSWRNTHDHVFMPDAMPGGHIPCTFGVPARHPKRLKHDAQNRNLV